MIKNYSDKVIKDYKDKVLDDISTTEINTTTTEQKIAKLKQLSAIYEQAKIKKSREE